MAYSLNKLRDELVSKNLSENGLVAWGQNSGMGGILPSATTPMFVISSANNKIIIIPFNNKQIVYDGGITFDRESILSAKIAGFWIYSKFRFIKYNNCKKKFFVVT